MNESRPSHVQLLLDAETRPVPPVLREVGDAVAAPVRVARRVYTDPEIERAEVDKVWHRTWLMACRLDQIPEVGDSIVFDVADLSLVVLRMAPGDGASSVRALHNSCLHRGTRLRSGPGRIEQLRCPFHAFTWRLDGSFAGMPCPWDFPDVDHASFCLAQAAVGVWGGFVFVHAGTDPEPLDQYLEVLPRHFAGWDLAERVVSAHVVRRLACNWKVALEAFIESYHTVSVHPQLLTTSGDTQTQYDVWRGVRHVNRMITPVGVASEHVEHEVSESEIVGAMFMSGGEVPEMAPGASARSVLADKVRSDLALATGRSHDDVTDCEALDAIEYFVFPNFVPWAGFTTPLVYRFRPDGVSRSIMDVMLLEPAPEGERPAAAPTRHLDDDERWASAPELGYLGRILDQDTATLGRVQRGLESWSDAEVVFAAYQESRLAHFHATLEGYLTEP
ncbi:MAG: aromatic ring-hydroxylating oxygenase subunit alpha [Acidimicrobiales bacterium]